ncbi:TIGR03067 domain-containing protein [Paludibaculum fermentans]|uniref:TIGR03067 domain-containing protein n=1 Tax=Paludibaculum fermentans TaxID=1473598 RepID=A0A7S7NKC1_PALFE|nr:TIGR03067 domain-containing protein [Paludibaculum fermentans]QOY85220.1 TIGR03067 domain-containing protein [Paludibaculum fermentans]
MPQDLDHLQGTWLVTSLELDGQSLPESLHAEARITVTGPRFQSTGMGAVYEGTLRLDETQTPAHLDMHFEAGPETGNTNLAIYELAGATWRLCLATRGNTRPTSFATTPGSGIALETLTRDTPGASARQPAEATPVPEPSPSAGEPVTELGGKWTMVSGIVDGKQLDPSTAGFVKRVTQGSKTTISAGPQTMLQFEFTADPSASPKAIDYRHTAGPIKGKTQLGIYEFEGALLRIHMAAAGEARPTEFTPPPGSKSSFTIWKKA